MALWQANFADLASVGIEVTDGQREALLRGGEVLTFQSLTEPGGNWCQCGTHHVARDTEGNAIMVAQIMRTWPADDVCPSDFHRPAGTTTLAEVADEHYGDHWKFWPSYVGHHHQGVDAMDYDVGWYEETPIVRRIWSGIPVAEIGKDIAQEILLASNSVVESTPWWFVDRMIGYLQDDEAVPLLTEDGQESDDVDIEYVEAARGLAACGLFDLEKADFTEDFSLDLAYPPMANYLTPGALSVWNELIARSRMGSVRAARTIRRGERNTYQYNESGFDPWF